MICFYYFPWLVLSNRAACVWFALSCFACRRMTMECLCSRSVVYIGCTLAWYFNTPRFPFSMNIIFFYARSPALGCAKRPSTAYQHVILHASPRFKGTAHRLNHPVYYLTPSFTFNTLNYTSTPPLSLTECHSYTLMTTMPTSYPHAALRRTSHRTRRNARPSSSQDVTSSSSASSGMSLLRALRCCFLC
jgi:hypothetical protein